MNIDRQSKIRRLEIEKREIEGDLKLMPDGPQAYHLEGTLQEINDQLEAMQCIDAEQDETRNEWDLFPRNN